MNKGIGMNKPSIVERIVTLFEELIKLYGNPESYKYKQCELTSPAIKAKAYLRGQIDALKDVLQITEPTKGSENGKEE